MKFGGVWNTRRPSVVLKTLRNVGWTSAVLVGSMAMPRSASADAAHGSVAVLAEGPDKDLARSQVASGVGNDYALVDAADWQSALAEQGHRGPLGPSLKDAKKRKQLIDQLRRAAHGVQADEVIVVVTSRTAHGRDAALMVVDPAASDTPAETHIALNKGDDNLAQAVRQALPRRTARSADAPSAAAATTAAPAPPAPEPPAAAAASVATEAPARDTATANPAQERVTHVVGQEALNLSVGVEGGMRRFSYKDGLYQNLRPYQINAAPLVAAEGELYPLPLFGVRTPPLFDVGAVLGYARALGLQSSGAGTGNLTTQWSRYYVGGRIRARLGSDDGPTVGLVGAYGDEAFTFTSTANTPLPAVDYHFARVSGDFRVPIARLSFLGDGHIALFGDIGYLFVLSAGDVAARFPKSSVGGVEAKLGGALGIASGWEARLTASYRRFFYAMNPTPGDTYVAGGALDEFGGLQASIAYVY